MFTGVLGEPVRSPATASGVGMELKATGNVITASPLLPVTICPPWLYLPTESQRKGTANHLVPSPHPGKKPLTVESLT